MKNIIILTTILSLASLTTIPAIANSSHQHHQTNNGNKIKPVVIPNNQLPEPLTQGIVFREIASGGITGRTYQTVLMNNGRLIRVSIGDANDSQRSVRRVSQEKVKQFERLLNKVKFAKFNKLSYPAPQGAADYITYTLTSQTTTTQYNDISQSQLPNKLTEVVKAWNELKNSAK
ncbi:hypothetical protein [Anabaena catenula]|uniref:Uncharacterized protein n=1 Tax=Anabaena catenula FACHB-362 TaxID=2692877 RepID=A0ABR8J9W1_9NOST|nr:hypothetical protein [Anabaena catenula]MBD2693791.1 hypothetical protein [Anabaena catenula FACHB-362]